MSDDARAEEIAAVVARLREEVRRRSPVPSSGSSPLSPIRLTARQEAERLWPVTADRPLQRRSGPSEILLRPVRIVLRKLMRWYVEPPFADQREFNSTVLELIDDLTERTSAGLARLEGALPDSADPPDAGPYAEDLRGAAPVLTCETADDLERVSDGVLGAVVLVAPNGCPTPEALVRVLQRAAVVLRPAGVMIAEAGGALAPDAAAAMAREAGFVRADVRFGAGPHGYALVLRR